MTSSRIRNRYEALRLLGGGSQGEVIEAIDHLHDRRVAIKVRVVPDEGAREQILREARTLFALQPHPGVALVREDFFIRDRYYLVMDHVEGQDLRALLAERRRLPLGEAVPIVEQVAAALEHLHAHDPPVLHLDVKPANVIVTAGGRAVLVDFGIAGTRGAGTPGFRAPEILAGDTPGTAADVYGLAVTAFCMLTGAPPRVGDRPSFDGVPATHAGALERAFTAALAYDPARRPPGAQAFVDAIRPPRTPTNLPAAHTSFIGREEALATVAAALRGAPVTTIVGAGGCGKTRLAVRAADAEMSRSPDGVWLVELASLADPEAVARRIAGACGIAEQPGIAIEDTIIAALGDGRVLLVLDNCEHLLHAAATAAARISAGCPNVRILATSRAPLGLPGETVVPLAPLEVPASRDRREIERAESVRLFRDRARVAHPGFALTEDNASAVADLCARLDGLPLAIELAASRAATHAPDRIAASLGDASLGSTIAWSHDLLSAAARTLFRRLAVFAGTFDLGAVRAICTDEALPDEDVIDVLARLVATSLVQVEPGGQVRYRILETIRTFADDRLTAAGEAGAVRSRLVAWATALADGALAGSAGTEQAAWLDRLETEHDNLRAALTYATALPDGDDAATLASALSDFWLTRGHWTEGRQRQLASAEGRAPTASVAAALAGAGTMAESQGDPSAAEALYERSLAAARSVGDRRRTAIALRGLANVAYVRADLGRARTLMDESLQIAREIGNTWGIAIALNGLGSIAVSQHDLDAAAAYYQDALEAFRTHGNERGIATSLRNLATVARLRGDLDGATAHLEACMPMIDALGLPGLRVYALIERAIIARVRGRAGDARLDIDAAIALAAEHENTFGIGLAELRLAELAADDGDHSAARALGEDALAKLQGSEDGDGIVEAMTTIGRAARANGDADAANLLEDALAEARRLGSDRFAELCRAELAILEDHEAQIGPASR